MRERPTPGSAPGAALRSPDTLSARMAEDIERWILVGELLPGDQLPPEADLGRLFQVSRSVVRDAVRILSARGLVEVRQGAGTVVAEPSDASFLRALVLLLARSDLTMGEVIDARAAVEIRLAGLAAQAGTEADWNALAAKLKEFDDAVRAREWDAAFAAHLDFHLGIVRAVHMPALELLLLPMQNFIVVSSLPPEREDEDAWEVDGHYPILDAMRSGDGQEAERQMACHFATGSRDSSYLRTLFRDALTDDTLEQFRGAGARWSAPDIGTGLKERAKRGQSRSSGDPGSRGPSGTL